nr:protein tfg-1-like [Desmodus rotundus]
MVDLNFPHDKCGKSHDPLAPQFKRCSPGTRVGPESQGPPRALKAGSLAAKWLAALRATTCSALHDSELRTLTSAPGQVRPCRAGERPTATALAAAAEGKAPRSGAGPGAGRPSQPRGQEAGPGPPRGGTRSWEPQRNPACHRWALPPTGLPTSCRLPGKARKGGGEVTWPPGYPLPPNPDSRGENLPRVRMRPSHQLRESPRAAGSQSSHAISRRMLSLKKTAASSSLGGRGEINMGL